ncbi:alpha-N-acetylgalactosamine-specific lectin-like [Gigantopelta aegis]|uniref:alpha-N-acetylgalactosamine-specific lectin-like n=1 Tax=Gigantopelta aegis TaxID=1735272 RepID=UPI001B88D7B3|nr:alpha-N-acetylgalactosamine-specific lectin-like [Gigantopelta aegis]
MRKYIYSVGETVALRCKSSSVIVTRRCLSDGSWSSGGYVCGGCPTGWSAFNRSCYKYFPSHKTYREAEGHCAAPGGTVATMASREEMDFVASLGHKTWKMWVGATDRAVEGEFLGADNLPLTWDNWNEGEPNNQGNEDCVVANGEDKNVSWIDVPCSGTYSYVCELSSTCDNTAVNVGQTRRYIRYSKS